MIFDSSIGGQRRPDGICDPPRGALRPADGPAYRVFTERQIRRALADSGFTVRSIHRQFVLPTQFHRLIGSRRFTLFIQGLLDRAGLLRFFGSPVTVCAERCAPS